MSLMSRPLGLLPEAGDIRPHDMPLRPRLHLLTAMWVQCGSGLPTAVRWGRLARAALFVAVGAGIALGTAATTHRSWLDPLVLGRLIVWALVWHLAAPGRLEAPWSAGGLAHWLRRGTVRLPSWGGRVPFTAGTTRTGLDVALYAVTLALGLGLLVAPASSAGGLPPLGIASLLSALGLLGLRDRTPFVAARPELHVAMLVVFLFPLGNVIIGLKIVLVVAWWTAAAAALNRNGPFAVAVALSDAWWNRSRPLRRRLWQLDSDDLRPSELSRGLAHGVLLAQLALPLLLVLGRGGAVTFAAVSLMLVAHLLVLVVLPRASAPETLAFTAYVTVVVFGHYGSVGFAALDSVPLAIGLAVLFVGLPLRVALTPGRVALLAGERQLADNAPTSIWLCRPEAAARLGAQFPALAGQGEHHDRQLAFQTMHTAGRAIEGLLGRAVRTGAAANCAAGSDAAVEARAGETVAEAVLGWAFAPGYAADRQLLGALQERLALAPGQLRVVTLGAQPAHRSERRYRILDAADGLIEDGLIDVGDILDRVPWRSSRAPSIPVDVLFTVDGAVGYSEPSLQALLDACDMRSRPRPPAARPAPPRHVAVPVPAATPLSLARPMTAASPIGAVSMRRTIVATPRPPAPRPSITVSRDAERTFFTLPASGSRGRHAAPDDHTDAVTSGGSDRRPRHARPTPA